MDQQLILDRYRPLEELGRGGFATVTLAWDTRMQRRVAIKRLPLPRDRRGVVDHTPPGLAEARTAALLNHPSIVTVYDFETDADEAFLIMEHVDGANLDEILDDVGGALTLDEAAAVIEAVSGALEFAHENGVLHLDIKPGNVLIARDGRVKVTDFGMAELSTLSGHGPSFGGTVGYMPLEQLGGMHVTEASDEWALGALAYECLTGDNPFDAEDVASAIVLLETLDPPRASAYEPDLPHAIDEVLFAATGPHPADRYQSVADFSRALLPHLGNPAAGRESLAELVSAYATEEPVDDDPGWSHVGLWDRLNGPAGVFAVRTVAAAESAWLTWAGLVPTHLQPLALGGAVALVALVGALAPSLGTGLGLIAFAIGLFAQGLWLLATLFSLGTAAWWWFVARRSASASILPLAAPVLGMAYVPYLAPLIAGFVLPPLPAMAAGFVGGVLQLLASSASAQSAPYTVVDPRLLANPGAGVLLAANVRAAFLDPAAWVALMGWPVAALLMSLLCRRASRLAAFGGALLGAGAFVGAAVLARMTAAALHQPPSMVFAWSGTAFAVSLGGSLILVVLVIVLGAPVRAEEEDLVHASHEGTD